MQGPLDDGHYTLSLFGCFALSDGDGQRIDIPSKRGRALIAMLAMTPGMERERNWLIAQLWSDRDLAQGQTSLRQEVFSLRRLLNGPLDIIEASRQSVWLNPQLIRLEIPKDRNQEEFLAGLDIPGAEGFEDWLRTERRRHRPPTRPAASPDTPSMQRDAAGALRVSIRFEPLTNGEFGEILSHQLKQDLLGLLSDFGGVRILSDQSSEACDLDIRVTAAQLGSQWAIGLVASIALTGEPLVVLNRLFETASRGPDVILVQIGVYLSEFTDRVFDRLDRNAGTVDAEGAFAAQLAARGVRHFFSRREGGVYAAESSFDKAIALVPASSYYAWKSYLGALYLEEEKGVDAAVVREFSHEYAMRALELDPGNPLSHALLAHVFAFTFRDFDRAFASLDIALAFRPNHVMTRDAEAILSFYSGDLARAKTAAIASETLGRTLPFRYCFVTSRCMVETLLGNFNAGRELGERARALLPLSRPNETIRDYPPMLRYLGICQAQQNDLAAAATTFDRLERLEGALSSRDLDPDLYPMPSKRAFALFRDSLVRVGR